MEKTQGVMQATYKVTGKRSVERKVPRGRLGAGEGGLPKSRKWRESNREKKAKRSLAINTVADDRASDA